MTEPAGKVNNMAQLKMPFPWKLYHMLEEAEKPVGGFSNVVSWLPDGKAFKIYDQETFSGTAMQQYFNQSKIKSFTRQLYIYGFLKVPNGPNEGAFYHPEFIRGNKESCFSLRRNQAGDRRRIKVSRRGSASSFNSSGSITSADSYESGSQGGMASPVVSGSNPLYQHSSNPVPLTTVKAQRRSSLSDYVTGRPPAYQQASNFPMQKQRRRSSMGSAFPMGGSNGGMDPYNNNGMGYNQMSQFDPGFPQQQQQHQPTKRRNSLSDFFEQAISLLPSDGAYANLPCLDDINIEPTPIGSMNSNNNMFTMQQQQQQQQNYGVNSPPPMTTINIMGGMNNNSNSGNLNGSQVLHREGSSNLDDLEDDNEDDLLGVNGGFGDGNNSANFGIQGNYYGGGNNMNNNNNNFGNVVDNTSDAIYFQDLAP
eukprot:Nitzschia sp. Nitz4//scaffold277_size25017//6077//7456//NITZ4_008345-RA/size25017-augustus-gene-0.21-mRNA-1//-1//CDS//3329545338//4082//frame0